MSDSVFRSEQIRTFLFGVIVSKHSQFGLTAARTGSAAMLMLSGLLYSGKVAAQEIDWREYGMEQVQTHVLPAYQRFANETQALGSATAALCQQPMPDQLAATQRAYVKALHAWQGVSHIQYGPVLTQNRTYSIQFWPDVRGLGARQLSAALALPADTRFDQAFFSQSSVGIKGLPALERLLFGEDALQKLSGAGLDCRLTVAISSYLADTAKAIHSDWLTLSEEQRSPEYDANSGSRLNIDLILIKSLVEPIEQVRDNKLLAVLGPDAESSRPYRAESWISKQSLANIRENMQAAQALYYGEKAGFDKILREQGQQALAEQIEQHFRLVDAQLAPLGDSLTDALQQDYDAVKEVLDSMKQLYTSLYDATVVLGIRLGFNRNDSD